jgi:DUF1009 family protein
VTLAPNPAPPAGPGEAQTKPLAILCGGGALPLQVAKAALEGGRDPLVIGIVGAADEGVEAFRHLWFHIGEVGKLFRALKERAIVEIAIVGAMTRPEFADLRLDWGALTRLASLASLFRGGDNHLLVGISKIFENEGVRVIGVHQIAPQLLAPSGALGARAPSPHSLADAVRGANGRVLAIEAAEGTDAMLARIAELRGSRRLRFKGAAGVLVKAPKRDQDLRLDMPTVGLKTIESAKRAELEGIALAAGRVLIADRASFARAADEAGLFVFGLEA